MAFLGNLFSGGGFDANQVEPSAPMEIIPPGKYSAQIVESEMKDSRSGGKMLALTFEIIDGPSERRKLWTNLNLVHANPTAEQIAQRDLSAICHAVGKLNISDSEELHFKPLQVTVKVIPAGPDKHGVHREAKNEIGGYSPLSGNAAAPAAAPRPQPGPAPARAAAPPPARAAAPAAASPPWRRSA